MLARAQGLIHAAIRLVAVNPRMLRTSSSWLEVHREGNLSASARKGTTRVTQVCRQRMSKMEGRHWPRM